MPRQGLAVAATALIVLLAGCSSLTCTVGLGNCESTATPTFSPVTTDATATDTPTVATFGANTDTSSIVLSLTNTPDAYNFSSESKGSGKPDERSVLQYHHRTFTISDPTQSESLPSILISGLTIYDSVDTAEQATPGIVEETRVEEMTSEAVQLTSETKVTKLQGTTETNRKVVVLTHRQNNMVLYLVVASPNGFFSDEATDWFVQMLSGL